MKVFTLLLLVTTVFANGKNTSSLNLRYVRSTYSKLDESLGNLRTIARLMTGIEVQLGLLDKSIASDELIGDLLRLGTTTPAQIKAIDPAGMTTSLSELTTLHGKLNTNADGVKRIEDRFLVVHSILEAVEGVTDFRSWPGEAEFKTEIENIEKDGNEEKQKGLMDRLNQFSTSVNNIDTNNFFNNDGGKSDVDRFKSIANYILNQINTHSTRITSNSGQFFDVKKANSLYLPVERIISAVEITEKNKQSITEKTKDTEDYKSFDDNLETLKKTGNDLSTAITNFRQVETVLKTREMVYPPTHFVGFLRGYEDLQAFFDSFVTPFVQQLVKSDKFEKSLQSLKTIGQAFRSLDASMSQLNVPMLVTVRDMLKLLNSFMEFSTNFNSIKNTSSALKTCISDTSTFTSTNNIDDFKKAYDEVRTYIDKMNSGFKTVLSNINTDDVKQKINKVISLCITSDDQLQQSVENIKKSPEVKQLETLFSENFRTLDIDPPNFDDVTTKSGTVNAYLSTLTEFETFFKCLQTEGLSKSQEFAKSLKSLITIRGTQSFPVDEAMKVAKQLAGISSDLTTLETAITKDHGPELPEEEALRLMTNFAQNSKTIGTATRGVAVMHKLIEKKPDLVAISQYFSLVGDETANAGSSLSQTDTNDLNKIAALGTQVNAMYQSLDAWGQAVPGVSSTELKDYVDVFTSAKSVSGVSGLDPNMLTALQNLEEQTTDPVKKANIGKVKKAVENLMSLEVDFVSYSQPFDSIGGSLVELENFFTQFELKTARVTSEPCQSMDPASKTKTIYVEKDNRAQFYTVIALLTGCFITIVSCWTIITLKYKAGEE